MMHRLRSALLAAYYALRINHSFSVRDGHLYIPSRRVHLYEAKNGVTKILLRGK